MCSCSPICFSRELLRFWLLAWPSLSCTHMCFIFNTSTNSHSLYPLSFTFVFVLVEREDSLSLIVYIVLSLQLFSY